MHSWFVPIPNDIDYSILEIAMIALLLLKVLSLKVLGVISKCLSTESQSLTSKDRVGLAQSVACPPLAR